MLDRLEQMEQRYNDLQAQFALPEVLNDHEKYQKTAKALREIEEPVEKFRELKEVEKGLSDSRAMLAETDPDLRAMAEEEIAALEPRKSAIEEELKILLLPKDPNDEKNVNLEIRAGTGGDEASLFAAEIFRMYTRFAERNRWQVELVSESPGEAGGFKEVIARIVGNGAYSKLKFESGGHRVQRVPATETQGRIHTSAATVAVMPEADDASDVQVNPSEVRVDTFRASGAGGQHVNKTDSAVRLTHAPTGIVVECQDARSQHKNREQAWRVLAARIKDKQMREQQAKEAAERKSLVGSGDRSDRIRTYNFPQGRVTDHRINLTLHKIDAIMDGELDDITGALAAEHQAEQLASLSQAN